MARDVLPIVGSVVGGFFGPRLSWWRRALIWLAQAGLPKPSPMGRGEDGPELFVAGPGSCTINIVGPARHDSIGRIRMDKARKGAG